MSRSPDQQPAAWSQRLATLGRIEFGFNRRRDLVGSLIASSFAAVGVLGAVLGDLGWWIPMFFGGIGLVLLTNVLRRPGVVVVDNWGVSYERWKQEIAWADLLDVRCWPSGTLYVRVTPDCFAANIARRSLLSRTVWRVGVRSGTKQLSLPAPLDADVAVLAAWLVVEAAARRGNGPDRPD